MAMRTAPVPDESVSCNVVPLLDIMFLLLIFLMLGSDMSHAELGAVALPTASAAEAVKDSRARRVTLNVVHREVPCELHAALRPCRDAAHWAYELQGREYDEDGLPARLAEVAQDAWEPQEPGARRLSAVTLSIRCDRDAPYRLVQRALGACADAGIHRTEVAAALPAR